MELWVKKLTEQIVNIVGTDKAVHYQTVILPNIAMDFYRMLKESQAGYMVSEEYMMEDNSMKIVLNGLCDKKGKCTVTGAKVISILK